MYGRVNPIPKVVRVQRGVAAGPGDREAVGLHAERRDRRGLDIQPGSPAAFVGLPDPALEAGTVVSKPVIEKPNRFGAEVDHHMVLLGGRSEHLTGGEMSGRTDLVILVDGHSQLYHSLNGPRHPGDASDAARAARTTGTPTLAVARDSQCTDLLRPALDRAVIRHPSGRVP